MNPLAYIGKSCLRGLMLLFGALPLKLQYMNARFLAWFAGSVLKYRRKVALDNLTHSFPEKNEAEIKSLCKAFYRHFADLVAEAFWFGASSASRIRKQGICRIANPEVPADLYDNCNGVVLLSSHMGNWELYGGIELYNAPGADSRLRTENFYSVYKKQSSKIWDDILAKNRLAPLKGDWSGHLLESSDVVRFIFRHAGEKLFYNFITDQCPYRNSHANVPVEFMHRNTVSMTAGAALAAKFGMGIAYMGMRPEGRGHYVLEFTEIARNASGMDVQQIMQQYYRLLEKDLNAAPESYLWTHRRWKR